MDLRVDGQVAVVTGGATGIGRACAEALARAGAAVVIVGRTAERCEKAAAAIRQAGGRAEGRSADVCDPSGMQAVVEGTLGRWGRIDILVNSAGINNPRTLVDLEKPEWDAVIGTNVTGPYVCCRAVAPTMIRQGCGSIINIGSISGEAGIANRTAYCTSKAAVAHFTRALAVEFGPKGIRVNALAPNVVVTDLNRELIRSQPHVYDPLLARTPLGRLCTLEDIQGGLLYLASPLASFVTGQVLCVDGGFTAT